MQRRDFLGSFLGILVFLGGVVLLAWTFQQAVGVFRVAPDAALGVQKGKDLDVVQAGNSLAGVVIRAFMLVVMAVLGSLIANRGIALYQAALGPKEPKATGKTSVPKE